MREMLCFLFKFSYLSTLILVVDTLSQSDSDPVCYNAMIKSLLYSIYI